MEKLVQGVRNILASIVSWMDRADKEQEEQVRELLNRADKDTLPPGVSRAEDGSSMYDPRAAASAAAAGGGGATATSRHPFAPATVRRAGPPMPPASRSSSPSVPVGPPLPPPAEPKSPGTSLHGIKQHDQDDTSYMRRDAVVKLVEERYAHLPSAIQTALLARVLLPDGMKLLLAKLELESFGVAMADHDQVVDFIEDHGLEVFCARTGIHLDTPATDRPKPPDLKRRHLEEEPKSDPGGAMSRRGNARARKASTGGEHRMKLDDLKVKPVDLRPNQTPPEE